MIRAYLQATALVVAILAAASVIAAIAVAPMLLGWGLLAHVAAIVAALLAAVAASVGLAWMIDRWSIG